tara:strand:- start:790 stop:3081 length:2292 start_codon:yes stop_codon:yes gene_type:complete
MNKNTMKKDDIFDLSSKSYLAKLLATENIEVQINNVETASFDVQNRILTLPKYKVKSRDVLDMLVGHECSHALHTDVDKWLSIDDDKLRMTCNVLEDARIDKLIQKKYEGLKKNYINGFDLMMKHNFFGMKDINLESLSLIDKLNLFFKSSKRLDVKFTDEEKPWIEKTDNLKSMDDVIALAKDILAYQDKKDQEQELEDMHFKPQNTTDGDMQNIDSEESDDKSEDESDNDGDSTSYNGEANDDNSETKKSDDSENEIKEEDGKPSSGDSDQHSYKEGETLQKNIRRDAVYRKDGPVSLTQDAYDKAVNQKARDRSLGEDKIEYITLPTPNLKEIVIDHKEHSKNMAKFHQYYRNQKTASYDKEAYQRNETAFRQFKKDSMKTVNYLVKEFEMKKSATAYKRATTDKTGVLDPLKLKNYKFSDDIFKRLTVLPDAKNHGMIIMLDWSGSMADMIHNVYQQMANLVWFCKKTNIPFDVYCFTSSRNKKYSDDIYDVAGWSYKPGDIQMGEFGLVQLLSSEMKNKDIDRSLFELHCLTGDRYNLYNSIPRYMDLYSTPLNEALICSIDLVREFKIKHKVEKMIFTTMTDGAANGAKKSVCTRNNTERHDDDYTYYEHLKAAFKYTRASKFVIKRKNKRYYGHFSCYYNHERDFTGTLLDIIKKECDTTNIGYFLHSKIKRYSWDTGHFSDNQIKIYRKQKFLEVSKPGYDGYYHLVMGHKIANHNLDNIDEDASKSQITSAFKKNMKSRLTSRAFMNNLIEKIA